MAVHCIRILIKKKVEYSCPIYTIDPITSKRKRALFVKLIVVSVSMIVYAFAVLVSIDRCCGNEHKTRCVKTFSLILSRTRRLELHHRIVLGAAVLSRGT